jgi:hypothetical protein
MNSSIFSTLTNVTEKLTQTLSKSPFTNQSVDKMDGVQQLIYLVIFFVLIYLIMFIGCMIFNTSVVKTFSSVKHISTMDFFGLYIVIHLLFC